MTNPYPPQALSDGQAPWPQPVSPPSVPSWAQPQGPETAQPENFYQSGMAKALEWIASVLERFEARATPTVEIAGSLE